MTSTSNEQPGQPTDAPSEVAFQADLPRHAQALFPGALLGLLATLTARYRDSVDARLADRQAQLAKWRAGELPDFDPDTQAIRDGQWQVAPIPAPLRDRRVEITGPVERKMIINALNSGARVFMADFEDSSSPTWTNMVEGQVNLKDAVDGTIELTTEAGKHYRLNDEVATLIVRPRGWHLDEAHVTVGGRAVPAGIFDAAVYVYNNAHALIERGAGPYLYLPKLESWREAELWASVLSDIETALGLDPGTIKVTVLIETLPAVFQMHEILHALKNRIVGLNCGRWDYIFSYIKCLQSHPDRILPDRAQVTMGVPFLKAYSELLIQTCHQRGAFAMGGMAAQIPIKGDDEANAQAIEKVRLDKEREAHAGHDGTWVAHPGLMAVAYEVFNEKIKNDNQLSVLREDVNVSQEDLLAPCEGTITEAGVRGNLAVALGYMAAWFRGQGCVPINHLMEDAATAEIARAQVWQWIHHSDTRLDDGRVLDAALARQWLGEEIDQIKATHGEAAFESQGHAQAAALIEHVVFSDEFIEFLTLPGYGQLADND